MLDLLSLLTLCVSDSLRGIGVFLSSIRAKTSTGLSRCLDNGAQRGQKRENYSTGLVFWIFFKNPSSYAHISSIQRRIVTSREGE